MDNHISEIEAVIFDWAGTTIDYGCFAPLVALKKIFKKRGIKILDGEAREPMGISKWDHIKEMCNMERIALLWKDKFGKLPEIQDVDNLYADFEPMLFSILPNYTTPVPGMLNLISYLKTQKIKIGSTTGYTKEMMNIVASAAKKQGYEPDNLVTSDEVPNGRPYPWMCYINAMNLGVYPMKNIVKVGDTLSDIREGINAGTWSVGVVLGSSEMGLTEEEVNVLSADELVERMDFVKERFKVAGAHYIINTVEDLKKVIPKINMELKNSD